MSREHWYIAADLEPHGRPRRHVRHTTSAGGEVVMEFLDGDLQPIGFPFQFPSDDYDFTWSQDRSRIAVSDEKAREVRIHDWGVETPVARIPARTWGVMALSPDGTRLHFKADLRSEAHTGSCGVKTGYYTYDIATDDVRKHALGVNDLSDGIEHGKWQYVPGRRKGELVRLDLVSGEFESHVLEDVDQTFFQMVRSPTRPLAAAIGKRKTLYWLDLDSLDVRRTDFRKAAQGEHFAVGCFSGDGALLVLASAEKRSLVFDANTGEFVREFAGICYGQPYRHASVVGNFTRRNSHAMPRLDLVTGLKTEEDLREL